MPERQNRIDIYVGQRIQRRRTEIAMSIDSLASALDCSAEEIVAYEGGNLRIGPSTLFELSEILGKPLSYFFDEIANSRLKRNTDSLFGLDDLTKIENATATSEIVEMLLAINRIRSSPHRKRLLDLISSVEGLLENIAKEKT